MAMGQWFRVRARKIWGWTMGENGTGANTGASTRGAPLAYRLVITAILCVTILFIVVMVFFGWRGVFKDDAQVVAALTSAFAVIGTLVGAYFGIKSSNDARDAVRDVHDNTTATVRETSGALQRATGAVERAAGAAETATTKAADATSVAQQVSHSAQEVAAASQQAVSVAQQLTDRAQQKPNGGQQQTPPDEASNG
jgi:hypothetical protein